MVIVRLDETLRSWKEELREGELGPWEELCDDWDGLVVARAIDRGVREGQATAASYDIFRIEQLTYDATNILNNLMALERRYHELRAEAESAAAEFALFSRQAQILKSLDRPAGLPAQRLQERDAHRTAADILEPSPDVLAQGQGAYSRGMAEALGSAATSEDARQGLQQDKWNVLEAHQALMLARHTEPGGALNYGERARRVRRLMIGELRSMAPKLYALHHGIRRVFDINRRDLFQEGPITLENVYVWLRDVADLVELRTINEVLDHRQVKKSVAAVIDASESGFLRVEFGLGEADGRVRGVGLSLVPRDGLMQAAEATQPMANYATATLYPPRQQTIGNAREARKPVTFSFVPISNTTGPPANLVSPPQIRNISPGGIWAVAIDLGWLEGVASETRRAGALILHLVVARPPRAVGPAGQPDLLEELED